MSQDLAKEVYMCCEMIPGAPMWLNTAYHAPEFENHITKAVQQAEQAAVHFLLPATGLRTVSLSSCGPYAALADRMLRWLRSVTDLC